MFGFIRNSNKLKRKELINILEDFFDNIKAYPIFEIPDKCYLEFFDKLKNKLNLYELKEDKRFVTYGRLDFLKEELNERLNDEKLKYPDPNWKNKWDNRMGAFLDLSDYIRGIAFFSFDQVPEGESFKGIFARNNEYYKDGCICKQEKVILLEMITAIENYIYQRKLEEDRKINKEEIDKLLQEIKPEVDEELIELGFLKIVNGKKIPVFGCCHKEWEIEKRLLKERYNIDWKTPAERYPFINYD